MGELGAESGRESIEDGEGEGGEGGEEDIVLWVGS